MPIEQNFLEKFKQTFLYSVIQTVAIITGFIVAMGRIIVAITNCKPLYAYFWALSILVVISLFAIFFKKGEAILVFIKKYRFLLFSISLGVLALWLGFKIARWTSLELESNFADCPDIEINIVWNGDWISHEERRDTLTRGVIQFSEVDDSVYGIYFNPLGEVNKLYAQKSESDSILKGHWINFENRSKGRFEFEMQKDGTFQGTYTKNNKENIWNGKREGDIKIIQDEIRKIFEKKEVRVKVADTKKPSIPEGVGKVPVLPSEEQSQKGSAGDKTETRSYQNPKTGFILVGKSRIEDGTWFYTNFNEFIKKGDVATLKNFPTIISTNNSVINVYSKKDTKSKNQIAKKASYTVGQGINSTKGSIVEHWAEVFLIEKI